MCVFGREIIVFVVVRNLYEKYSLNKMASNGTIISDVHPKLNDMDYSIITAVFVLSSAIGLYFGIHNDKTTTTKQFLYANYKSNSVLIGISLAMR